jgi:hypothetical protein
MADRGLAERAMEDPARVFDSPEAVIAEPSLAPEGKRSILRRWRERLVGEQTAAAPGGPDLATRIGRALAMLDTETGAHEVDHDQGFYTSVSDIGKE